MYTNILALTAGLAATASAFDCSGNYFSFFNRGGNAMSYQRLDPVLYPGTTSPHLHSFDGGSSLTASSDTEALRSSTCSTARIKTDKSLYWRPTLFFNGNGTGFYRVPEQYTKVYYKYGDGNDWANVTGFPEDFGMIAGDPFKRSDGDNPAGVRWGCHQPDGASDPIFSNGFPKGFSSCKYGFASEVTFPSCWNGKKSDPANPSAHMAYPTGYSGVGIERCPTTHRAARFPTIFIEFWYDISSFDGQYDANSSPWALSNGDPTGFGFHADFMNGWEAGVLEKATAENTGCRCGCGCGQTEMEQCFGKENVNNNNDADFEQCSAGTPFGNDAGTHLETLPGCNPLQSGPARATVVTGPSCAATAAPANGNPSSVTSGFTASATGSATGSPAETPAPSSKASETSSLLAYPSLSVSLPNKVVEPKPTATDATPADETAALPSLSLVSSAKPADQTGSPAEGEDCIKPVTVTVTPTVTVTAGVADITSCASDSTVTTTIKQYTTVTVEA